MNKHFLAALLVSCFINAGHIQSGSGQFRLCPIKTMEVIRRSTTDSTVEGIWKAKYSKDFPITGDGSAANWNSAEWLSLPLRSGKAVTYKTKIKMLYSDS